MDLRDAIQRLALEMPSYGRPRITAELRRRDWVVNAKRVYRLMREDNLLCVRRRKFVVTTDSEHALPVYPNLARHMVLTNVDQLWEADITYVRLLEEFVFLAVILDAYSRRVIGWELDRTLEAKLTLAALRMALGYQAAISYNSCRNRHCPKCQTQAREHWLAARERELLPTNYFHVVFTVPHDLNVLALTDQRLFYDLLFAASAQTLLEVAADPKHLGAAIGLISILHTWGQNLLLHPHVHCAIPAGGLSPDHQRWVRPRYPFFLPARVLSRVFRGKFCAGLKRLCRRQRLCCAGPASLLADSKRFRQLLRRLHRQDWVVYAKPAFGGPAQVLRYLGRYTHRVAISNHWLLAFDGERVTFRWNPAHSRCHGRPKVFRPTPQPFPIPE